MTGTENFLVRSASSCLWMKAKQYQRQSVPLFKKEFRIAGKNPDTSRSHLKYVGSLSAELAVFRFVSRVETYNSWLNGAAGPDERSHSFYKK